MSLSGSRFSPSPREPILRIRNKIAVIKPSFRRSFKRKCIRTSTSTHIARTVSRTNDNPSVTKSKIGVSSNISCGRSLHKRIHSSLSHTRKFINKEYSSWSVNNFARFFIFISAVGKFSQIVFIRTLYVINREPFFRKICDCSFHG